MGKYILYAGILSAALRLWGKRGGRTFIFIYRREGHAGGEWGAARGSMRGKGL